jgi:thymidylate synthase (FAD)
MVSVTIEITTTRDISRQILRHRSFSFQEFSQRYAKSTNFETRECRLQDEKNRQNSIDTEDRELAESWNMAQKTVINAANDAYEWALENGIAKEQARAVLPEGNTETTLYMSGTLRSWLHYCKLRMSNGTQKEHIEVAEQCWRVISHHFPDVAKAVEEL